MNFLKKLFSLILIFSGISWFVRNLVARRGVSILIYHDPDPNTFRKQLNYLSRYYKFINIDQLFQAIYQRNWDSIPKKSIIITFDDGHKGNFRLLELFNKYNLQPTIYLCSEIINTYRNFWTKSSKISKFEKEQLKKLSNKERLIWLSHKGFNQFQPARNRQALNLDEISLMKRTVDLQSHGRFHVILTQCNDEELHEEIILSKMKIQELTKKDCCHFAYPNGNFNENIIKKLREAGYITGRTIYPGWNRKNTHPFKLKAIGVADAASVIWLKACLTGIPAYLKYFKEKLSRKFVFSIERVDG